MRIASTILSLLIFGGVVFVRLWRINFLINSEAAETVSEEQSTYPVPGKNTWDASQSPCESDQCKPFSLSDYFFASDDSSESEGSTEAYTTGIQSNPFTD